MRAALYARVASSDQVALNAQLEHLRKYAEKQNYEVAAVVALNSTSGKKANEYLDAVLHLVNAADVKKVIASNPSRIARDAVQFIEVERKFQSADIELEYPEYSGTRQLTDCTSLLIEYFNREKIVFERKDG